MRFWIETIAPDEAEGRLADIYRRVRGPNGEVDNILRVHSLRPHTLEGHMALYKAVLHHPRNRLPKWLLEAIGVYVSALNRCHYCFAHHGQGLARLLADERRSREMLAALEQDRPEEVFEGRELAAMRYARALTLTPADVVRDDVLALRQAGFDDGEILEIDQVTSYFAYANRTVLGLGVTTAGDTLGLSPGGGAEDAWGHG